MTEFMGRNIKKEFDSLTTEEIRDYSIKTSFPFVNLALNIHGNLNMGNILRTSHLCGCSKVVIFGRRHYDKRSAVGVYNYTNVERIMGLKNHNQDLTTILQDLDYAFDEEIFYKFINDNNYLPVFVEQSTGSIKATPANIQTILNTAKEINRIPIFIYGNEGTGIPQNILNTADKFSHNYILELNQKGALQSYNVSNSCAIVSYIVSLCFEE
jgi:tRNA G18 (ribose-2'-O)-methylase SpoU